MNLEQIIMSNKLCGAFSRIPLIKQMTAGICVYILQTVLFTGGGERERGGGGDEERGMPLSFGKEYIWGQEINQFLLDAFGTAMFPEKYLLFYTQWACRVPN